MRSRPVDDDHRRKPRNRVALVERLVDSVRGAENQPRPGDIVHLDRCVELRRHRRGSAERRAGGEHGTRDSVRGIDRSPPETAKVLIARVARRDSRGRYVVNGHYTPVGRRDAAVARITGCRLLRRPGVLRAAERDVRDGIPPGGMKFGRLEEVAVHREPVAGVGLRIRASIDAAVVALDEDAVGRDVHVARVRVGRRAARGTAAGRTEGARMRQVHELTPGRLAGIPSKQPARKIVGADRARERRRLPVAADVDDVLVVRIRRDRQVSPALPARMNAAFHRRGQIHLRPGCAAVTGPKHARQAPTDDDRRVDVVVAADRHVDVAQTARHHRVHRGVADQRPCSARIRAPEDTVPAGVGEQPRLVGRIARQIERVSGWKARARGARDRRPGRAAVGTAANALIVCRDDQRVAARGDAPDVGADENASAVDDSPGRPSVGGPQQSRPRAPIAEEAARASDASEQGLVRRVRRVEFERTDRERLLSVRLPHPVWRDRHGIGALPYAAVDGSDVNGVGVGRVRCDGIDRPGNFAVHDVLDLSLSVWRRTLRNPGLGRCGCDGSAEKNQRNETGAQGRGTHDERPPSPPVGNG